MHSVWIREKRSGNLKQMVPFFQMLQEVKGRIYFGSDDKNFYCLDTAGNLSLEKRS